MRVSWPKSRAQEAPAAGEAKQRMVTELLEVTFEGCALLLSVNRVFGGIDIHDEPPFVSAPKEGVGRSAGHIFQGFQPLTSCEDVVLKATECRSAGSIFTLFAQGQPKCRSTLG